MLEGVDIVYLDEDEGGVVVCILYQGHFKNQVGVLNTPPDLEHREKVKEYVKKALLEVGYDSEEDPHNPDTLHVFKKK